MKFLRELGIKSYMSGCMTLTFDSRTTNNNEQQDKIFIVDLDPKVSKRLTDGYLEKMIKEGIIDHSITHFYYWN